MSNPLSVLGEFITLGTQGYANILEAKNADKRLSNNTKIAELEYATARENRAAAMAAATTTKNVLNSDFVNKAIVWTLTTIAGGLLVTGVLRMVGVK